MRRPINSPFTITTEYGVPDSYAMFGRHAGVDYAVPLNRPVYAPAAGKIVYRAFNSTGGNMVIIHDGQFFHRILHLNSFENGQAVNHNVAEGQVIGYAGTTGLSTGVHVHWDIMDEIISSATPRPTSFAHFKDPAKWLAGVYKPAPQGGTEVANAEQVKNIYRAVLHREGDTGGVQNYTGRDANTIISEMLGSAERKSLEARYAGLEKALADTKQALANEQAKPPKEVIKEVVKIVEKPVEVIKEVPVYTHDEETKQNVNRIMSMVTSVFEYFSGQYKTFSKYVKKDK